MAIGYRECKAPGCTNLTKKTYCDEHKYIIEEREKARHRRFRQNRNDDKLQDFYQSKGWKVKKAMAKKRDNYLCVYCLRSKRIEPCHAVHHIIPINVDWSKRLELDNLISLCERHHRLLHNKLDLFPDWMQPSLVPVILVYGAPGSGKSTYVNKNKGPNDLVIDLDEIKAEISRKEIYQAGDEWLLPAITIRNEMLYNLSQEKKYDKSWFIISGARYDDREFWRNKLNIKEVILISANQTECIKRIKNDERRNNDISHVLKWFKNFEVDYRDKVIYPPSQK